jgi:FSR family fosmidomycin resistance protein-like MFS transporter
VRRSALRVAVAIALLHGLNDMYTGFLSPLLPRIMGRLDLSIALAATLATTLTLSSSLLQPVLGFWGDRRGARAFVVLGTLASGVFMSLIGIAPSFGALIVLLALGGLGSAAFHPTGASIATRAAEGRGSGARYSIFSFGGSLGYAVGPLLAVALVGAWGLPGLAFAMVPIVVLAAPLWRVLPAGDRHPDAAPPPGPLTVAALLRGPLGVLFAISAVATFVQRTFLTLQPIVVAHRGGTEALGALSLSVFLAGQAAGTLAGGALADRVDRRALLVAMTLLAIPANAVAMSLPADSWAGLAGAAFAGMLYMGMFPCIVVMAQEIVPAGTGVSSGIVMGLAWAAGSLGVLAIGALADGIGPELAALTSVPFLFVAAGLAALVPRR